MFTDNPQFAGHEYDEEFRYCITCGAESEICPCCGKGFPAHSLFASPEGVEPFAVYCTPCWETLFCDGGHPSTASVSPRKMNHAQEAKLRLLCHRYGVEFNADHYIVFGPASSMMAGWAEGWIGGKPGTLYVGVSPAGDSHS
jgi:hypothetical protein